MAIPNTFPDIVPSRPPEAVGSPALADSLKLSEEVFRAIFEEAGIGMALVDLEGRPMATNQRLREMLGYSEAELRAVAFSAFTHPEDVEADLAFFGELVRGERQHYGLVKRYVRRDGEILHGRLTVSVVRNPDGSPRYAVGMVEDVTEQRRAAEEGKRLRARLAAAQEEERRRIAEDLHDDPVQKLAAISIRLATMGRRTQDEQQREHLDTLQDAVGDVTRRLRSLMFDLRPPALDRDGLVETVREHLSRTAGDAGWRWEIVDRIDRDLQTEVKATAYRIIQEAVANARKHAEAHRVVVELASDRLRLRGAVRDDGSGFDPAAVRNGRDEHLGLASMRERAELFGGRCTVVSAPGHGTTVEFELPLECDRAP